jgi:hypothetical protein
LFRRIIERDEVQNRAGKDSFAFRVAITPRLLNKQWLESIARDGRAEMPARKKIATDFRLR